MKQPGMLSGPLGVRKTYRKNGRGVGGARQAMDLGMMYLKCTPFFSADLNLIACFGISSRRRRRGWGKQERKEWERVGRGRYPACISVTKIKCTKRKKARIRREQRITEKMEVACLSRYGIGS
jgi:hypothetical protein